MTGYGKLTFAEAFGVRNAFESDLVANVFLTSRLKFYMHLSQGSDAIG
jgi:hypothetical protein